MGQQYLQPPNENQLVALGRALQTLREEENADVLIETTLDYLASEFKFRLIWIGLYDRLEHRLYGKGGITPTDDTTFLKQRFNLNPGDLLEQVVIQQRLVGVPDLRQEIRAGEWRRAAQEFGIQGTLLFPLRCKDRCFGVALLGSHLWGVSPRPAEKAQLSLLLGGLAAALYQIEVEWQRSAIKRPDQPLFQVLDELMQVPALARRFEAVVMMTQQFVAPTRTNLYWYSPERRYFWHRVGNRQSERRLGDSKTSAPGLTVAEANDFYEALAAGQLVAIGAGRSLLSSESTKRLIVRLRTRSLLAAPIQAKGELLGFLSVEDNEARIWEEVETNYVRAMAQLVGLVAESEQIEATLKQTQQDAHFAAEIAQVIRKAIPYPTGTLAGNEISPLRALSNDTTVALKGCAELLGKRLDADRFLVLQEDDNGEFTLIFGTQPLNRRPLSAPLPPLSLNDKQSLLKSADSASAAAPEELAVASLRASVVMIEDLHRDLRLVQWRESLLASGVQSLLICQMFYTGNADKLSLLVIAHGTPRTWNHIERDLVSITAQQINLLLALESYSESARVSFLAHQTLTSGLSTLSRAPLDPVLLERTWLEYLATQLECPLAALISWTPESEYATVAVAVVTNPDFALPPDLPIPIANNILIQKALATSGFWSCSAADLTAPTRQLLSSPGIGQLLLMALHTGATPATGIVLLADHEERQWSDHLLRLIETLTTQFAWFRHYRHYLSRYREEGKNLQTLNWYKHRCLETLHQSLTQSISALLELEVKIPPPLSTGEVNGDNPKDLEEINTKPLSTSQPLLQMRRVHLLQYLEQTLTVLTPVLQDEQWQLTVNSSILPLASLLKRSLRRVEPLYNQRQLVLKVHNPGNKRIYGDRLKLECVLFELLVTSCVQAQPGSWINLWCCPSELKVGRLKVEGSQDNLQPSNVQPSTPLLELLIAENGLLDDCLHALTSSPPAPPPSLNLKICQQVVRSWGGDLQFFQLEADRYSSRLLLPLAN